MKTALTGGIACGKSLVAKFLRELGVQVLDADDVVHELEAPGGRAVPDLVACFGMDVCGPDGGIDRKRLADKVFSDPSARRKLEAILHPLVRDRLRTFLEAETPELRVVVIPLLFESHWDEDYDTIICVASSRDRQIERMMQTRGYTRDQAEARLAVQMPVAEKAARADRTVENMDTPAALKKETERLHAWLSDRRKNRYEH